MYHDCLTTYSTDMNEKTQASASHLPVSPPEAQSSEYLPKSTERLPLSPACVGRQRVSTAPTASIFGGLCDSQGRDDFPASQKGLISSAQGCRAIACGSVNCLGWHALASS